MHHLSHCLTAICIRAASSSLQDMELPEPCINHNVPSFDPIENYIIPQAILQCYTPICI